jgi:hypothetical protein
VLEVAGMAFCNSDDDCTISTSGSSAVSTGTCNADGRCECSSDSWTGPRCTETATNEDGDNLYGPPIYIALLIAAVACVATFFTVLYKVRQAKRNGGRMRDQALKMEQAKEIQIAELVDDSSKAKEAHSNPSFV